MLFKFEAQSSLEDWKEPQEVERHCLAYTDGSERFYKVSRDFSKQYAHIYAARLNTFRNILDKIVYKKWSNKYKILKLCDLREKGVQCVIVGTLFKHQELKPSILKQLSDQLEIIPQAPRTHFVHESDSLVLEDELQRIKLVGDSIDVNRVVTGVVCAVLGSEDEDGVFTIKDVCWSGCNIQKPLPNNQEERYIVLISGLNLASKTAEHSFSLQLLLEWLSGISGTPSYQEEMSKIVRVIVAGGTFTNDSNGSTLKEDDVIASADVVDGFCAALSSVAPLDLMPGFKDPSGNMLPQKPFHYCLFPKATEYRSFSRVSNPYECDVGGYLCLGSSGEPIKNILQYSKLENHLDAMEMTLQWRHMSPTSPDTMSCTPCVDTDPFVIYNCPAIYYCGNSKEFDTKLYKGDDGQKVRIVCVPDFCTSKTIALVNLANMECFTMQFS